MIVGVGADVAVDDDSVFVVEPGDDVFGDDKGEELFHFEAIGCAS